MFNGLWQRFFPALSPELQCAFDRQIDRGMATVLPILGPVCGAFVILFWAWDVLLVPAHAPVTLRIRIGMVLLGTLAYARSGVPWNASWRCAWLYLTHAGAVMLCAAFPPQGLVLALPGMTGAMFMLALIEPRPRRFLIAVGPPSVLLLALAILRLSPPLLLNTVLLYAVSLPLAVCVALANLYLRRIGFLSEQDLLYAVRHDSLSGALSRGYLTELALHDVALAERHGHPLAIAMLDIDHFKQVNDTFGHATGDLALCALVSICKAALRATDYIGRVGGEEFVCVMPETSAADALHCAERIRNDIAALSLATAAGELRFTVSIGVAVLDRRHADWPRLLSAADAALYRAKAAGRNRTLAAEPA